MASNLFLPLLRAAGVALLSSASLLAQGDAIKATTTLHPDGTQTITVTDPEKRTTEETTQTSSGKVVRKVTYLLDDLNQPLGAIVYDGKGNVLFRSSYRRDGMNRIDEENVTSGDGKPIRRRVYQYGANNKILRVDEYDPSGKLIIPPKKQQAQSKGRPDRKR